MHSPVKGRLKEVKISSEMKWIHLWCDAEGWKFSFITKANSPQPWNKAKCFCLEMARGNDHLCQTHALTWRSSVRKPMAGTCGLLQGSILLIKANHGSLRTHPSGLVQLFLYHVLLISVKGKVMMRNWGWVAETLPSRGQCLLASQEQQEYLFMVSFDCGCCMTKSRLWALTSMEHLPFLI